TTSAGTQASGEDPHQQIVGESLALRLEACRRSGALNPARDAIRKDYQREQAKGDAWHARILVRQFSRWKGRPYHHSPTATPSKEGRMRWLQGHAWWLLLAMTVLVTL